MYKDVLKRVLASVLTFCMIGSSPNLTLLAGEESTAATHTYPESFGEVISPYADLGDDTVTDKYIANAYTVGECADDTKNAQKITEVSFALDAAHIGDVTQYVNTAEYVVKIFEYPENKTLLEALAENEVASEAGTYKMSECDGAYFTVPMTTVQPAFGEGEKFIVKIELDGTDWTNNSSDLIEDKTDIVYQTANLSGVESYANGVSLSEGVVACIRAITEETLEEAPVTGISIEGGNRDILAGKETQLSINYTPIYTTQKGVTWSSDNEAVATVDENGVLSTITAGTANITAVSKVDSSIKTTIAVTVCKDVANLTFGAVADQMYTGEQIKPTINVKDGENTLVIGQDYNLKYEDANVHVGKGTVTVEGTGNGYLGTSKIEFNIIPVEMTSTAITAVCKESFLYDEEKAVSGIEIENPEETLEVKYTNGSGREFVLTYGTDYEITGYGNNTTAGNNAYAVLTGRGDYTGSIQCKFEIRKSLDSSDITTKLLVGGIEKESATYTGSAIKPQVQVYDGEKLLENGVDYSVAYFAADGVTPDIMVDAGEKKIVITGKGAYASTVGDTDVPFTIARDFEITRRNITTGTTISIIPNQLDTVTADTVEGLEITYGSDMLIKDTHYEVSVGAVEEGQVTITITGIGNFQGSTSQTVDVGTDIKNCTVEVASVIYTGSELTPAITVKDADGNVVDEENYYVVKWEKNKNACEDVDADDAPKVTIAGTGEYAGVKTVAFMIARKELTAGMVTFDTTVPYQKPAAGVADIRCNLKVTHNEITLKADTDYSAVYGNNTGVTDAATVAISGTGNYTGTVNLTYKITAVDVNELTYTPETIEDVSFTGSAVEPEIIIEQNGVALEAGVDYTIRYDDNVNIGTGYIVIDGTGNYCNSIEIPFEIVEAEIEGAVITEIADQAYTGSPITPEVTVTVTTAGGLVVLEKDTDYEVSYEDNIEAGKATVKVSGIGNYTGVSSAEFNIIKSFTDATVSVNTIADVKYSGVDAEPEVVVIDNLVDGTFRTLVEGTDYEVAYSDNTGVTDAAVAIITGIGNYKDSKEKSFVILPGSLRDDGVTVELKYVHDSYRIFTGSAVEPELVVKYAGNELVKNTDYTVSYENPVNVEDISRVAIDGINNFSGRKYFEYDIVGKSLNDSSIRVSVETMEALDIAAGERPTVVIKDTNRASTGESVNGGGSYTLVENKDYTLGEITTSGTVGTITITGRGNYQGSLKESFAVVQKEVEVGEVSSYLPADQKSFVYTGEEIIPRPVVKVGETELVYGEDYIVTTGRVDAGKGYFYTVHFQGSYTGIHTPIDTFEILPRDIADASIMVEEIPNQAYTGTAITPAVNITFNGNALNAKNYNISYENNISVGTATVKITATGGNFTGSRTVNFSICESIVSAIEVTGLKESYVYTSQPIEPEGLMVTLNGVKAVEGVDYKIVYANNINAKSTINNKNATLTIVGMGQYGGEKTYEFAIEKKNMQDANVKIKVDDIEFTGGSLQPKVEIIYEYADGKEYKLIDKATAEALGVTRDFDTTVTSSNNVGDDVSITIIPSGINFYADGNSFVYSGIKILPRNIMDDSTGELQEDIVISGVTDMQYESGVTEYRPNIVVKDRRRNAVTGQPQLPSATCYELTSSDYDITFTDNKTPGTATYTIKAKGNYTGTYTGTFKIMADISQVDVTMQQSHVYTGDPIEPSFTVAFATEKLKENVDYIYEFVGDHTNVGEATLKIIGIGSYAGSYKEHTFTITQKNISEKDVKMTHVYESYSHTGENIYPDPHFEYNGKKLVKDTDFTCGYEESCSAPGQYYSFTVKGKGNFSGEFAKTYKIGDNYSEKHVKVELTEGYTFPYTGYPVTPTVVVTRMDAGYEGEILVPDTDYRFEYENHVDAGTATVNTWGIPDAYAGNVSVTFEITPKSIGDSDVSVAYVADTDFCREEIKPTPAVFWRGSELIEGEDFEYAYENNFEAGVAKVIIKGIGNFTGENVVKFNIIHKDIAADNSGIVIEDVADQIYTGKEIVPQPKVTWDGKDLTLGTDYTIAYENNKALGEATITIQGIGSYVGTVTDTFNIIKVPVEDLEIEYTKVWKYTGKPIEPAVKIYYTDAANKRALLDNGLFTIEYKNTLNHGKETGVITITGNEYHEGTRDCYYTIEQRELKDSAIVFEKITNQVIDGATGAARPIPVLTFRPDTATSYTMVEGEDYEILSYTNNTVAGQTGTITISGLNNFTGEISQDFYIGEDISEYVENVEFTEDASYVYDGKPHTPAVTVTLKTGAGLVLGEDYEILYDGKKKEDIIDDAYATKAGEHKVLVSGLEPYGGSYELTYTIEKRDIALVEFVAEPQIYTGSAVYPIIIGTDTDAITRLGEAESRTGNIGEVDIEGMWTNLEAFTTTCQGNNTEVGVVTVVITATEASNYQGTTTMQFEVVARDIADKQITSGAIDTQFYTGEVLVPDMVITDTGRNAKGEAFDVAKDTEYYVLEKDVDYEVVCTDNLYPGTATVTITGKNHYSGTITKQFGILADLSYAQIADIPAQEYTGEAVTPEITVTLGENTLEKDVDYTVSYANNVDRGTATVTIYPVGGSLYTGSQSAEFEISRELTQGVSEIILIDTSFVYTGEAITPRAAVLYGDELLTEGTHYTVEYRNNVFAGTATVVVQGIGAYSGTITRDFTIVKRSVIRCTFDNVNAQLYTGTETKQNVLVKDNGRTLVENQDYVVTYANNVNPGTASVIITGKGNYAGVKTIRYLIHVRDMNEITAKAAAKKVTVSWTAVSGAQGYAVYNEKNELLGKTSKLTFTNKKLKSMKTYSYKVRPYVVSDGVTYYGGFSNLVKVVTTPSKPKLKVNAQDNAVALSWKKIKGVSGYEIYRSTKKSGNYKKVKNVKKASVTSYTNRNLKDRKNYYYKVRAYKTVNGVKIYSKYSSVRSAKTK